MFVSYINFERLRYRSLKSLSKRYPHVTNKKRCAGPTFYCVARSNTTADICLDISFHQGICRNFRLVPSCMYTKVVVADATVVVLVARKSFIFVSRSESMSKIFLPPLY